MSLTKFTLATLAATLLASGCAERAPRSFVQPNVIKASDLDGTWYYLQTVTDAPPTSASAFIGLSSELLKIRFDIQENTIFAKRSVRADPGLGRRLPAGSEQVHGSDSRGVEDQPLRHHPRLQPDDR